MATKIHHNTAKKAKTHGIELRVDGNEIVAIKDGVRLASHMSGSVALQLAIEALEVSTLDGAARTAKVLKNLKKATKAATKARKVRDEDEEDSLDSEEERGGDDTGEDDPEEEAEEGKSVVKPKYKQAYKPHQHRCGDDLSQKISAHVAGEGEDGKPCVDMKKLKRFAQANECWVGGYASLNPGMARMNVRNRLAARIRREFKVVWA